MTDVTDDLDDSAAAGTATGRGPVRLHALAVELGAMAQNGLLYGSDPHDRARYERLRSISAEVLSVLAGGDPAADELRAALAAEAGHATPKVDVRGALFDAEDRVLLVREARDGLWALPGGWADALDTPTRACEREVAEEAGVAVRVSRLGLVHDASRRNGHAASPWHIYKLMFLVERLDDAEPQAGIDGETIDVGFFDCAAPPDLSTARTTADQLRLLRAHHREPARRTEVD